MPLSTPKFWHKRWSVMSILLIPFSWLYQLAHAINIARQGTPYKSKIPVICIGNAIAGGSGKTPTVMALIKIIRENNLAKNPVILTRGYGGDITTPTLVDRNKHNAENVGDEALLLAQHAPTIIAQNRAEGAKFAEDNKHDLIIMDDGLQNNRLHKDISFLVVDRQIDFGNNRILPAGPLREPLAKILPRIDSIICIGRKFHSDKPVFEAAIEPQNTLDTSKTYIAFAGLGYPEKFKNTLLDLGVNLVGWHAFPDHYPYTEKDLEILKTHANDLDATLITTEKDFVRLPQNYKDEIETLPITLNFKSTNDITAFLKDELRSVTE